MPQTKNSSVRLPTAAPNFSRGTAVTTLLVIAATSATAAFHPAGPVSHFPAFRTRRRRHPVYPVQGFTRHARIFAVQPSSSVGKDDDEGDADAAAGSFFHSVPSEPSEKTVPLSEVPDPVTTEFSSLMAQRAKPVPSSSVGGKPTAKRKKIVEIDEDGNPRIVNDLNNLQTDDQGYTLHTDEQTGEKARVFESLVEYPCKFPIKIVGKKEGQFVTDMVDLVAGACSADPSGIGYTERINGKWTSITVQAPVENAAMLYELYDAIGRDPRVKFKF